MKSKKAIQNELNIIKYLLLKTNSEEMKHYYNGQIYILEWILETGCFKK